MFALLLIVSVPPREPSAVGLKVTVTEHLDLGRIVAPHPLTIAKSPLATMLENVTGVVLLLFAIVTFFGLLTLPFPNTTLPSLRARGETFNANGTGVVVGVAVGVVVAVAVAVALATGVRTADGLAVGVAVCVEVCVAVAVVVKVAVDVAVDDALAVAVAVCVVDAVAVRVEVAVGVFDAVAVAVEVGVMVLDAV